MKKILFLFSIITTCFSSFLFSQGDDCATAVQLTNLSNFCSSGGAYTNATATASAYGQSTCWTNASQTIDVWFSFVSIGTDAMITVKGSGISTGATLKEASIALYTGSCGGTLTEEKCMMSTSSNNLTSMYQGGMALATTHYIRVTTIAANKGKFDLCINNFNPVQNPNSPNDCDKGTIICNKDAVSIGLLASYGTNTTEHQLPGSCMTSPERNSTWLEFKCSATGTLDFDLSGTDVTNDLDWILMEITSMRNCATKTLVSCNLASCDINGAPSTTTIQRKTGLRAGESAAALIGGSTTATSEVGGCNSPANGYNNSANITAGKTYALFINNDTGVEGFSITWGGTSKFQGPEPAITTDKTVICIGESIQASGTTSTAGTYTSLDWTMPSSGVPTSYTGAGPFAVTFNKTGTYPLILKGTDAQGCINYVNKNITVNGLNADFTAPSVCVGSPTVFTCPIPALASYAWSFGDGTTGTGITANHTYATAGNYTATLTITGGGCTNVFTHTVSVLGAALTITPASPNICPGNSVNLAGTATVTGNVSKSKPFSQNTAASVPHTDGYSIGINTDWDGSIGSTLPSYPASNIGTSSILVSGLSTTNWSINSICINVASAKPKFNMIYIETPCGQRIKLVEMKTTTITGTNFTNACFTTAGTFTIGSTGHTTAPFTGTFAADELALWNSNLLSCSNPNGTWKLLVGEYLFGSGVNTSITNWTIDFQTDVPNTLKTLVWSPTTNLSAISYSGLTTASGTAAATTSTAETITLTGTDENNCVSTKQVTIVVGGPTAPTVANVNYCQNATASALTATGTSLLWYTTATLGTGSATAPTPLTTSTGTVSYWVTQTSGGCESARAKIDVIVTATPSLTITPPLAVCSPSTVDITAAAVTAGSTGGGTLTYWTDALATATSLGTANAVTTSGTYYIKSTAGSCKDIKSVLVTINPKPSLVITPPAAVCSPSTVDITATSVTTGSTGGGTLTYWVDALANATSLGTASAVTTSGTYYIKSTAGSCTDIKSVLVTINTKPSLTITSPGAVCQPLTVDLTNSAVTAGSTGGGVLSYWTNIGCTTPLASPSTVSISGTYYIKATTVAGSCTDSKPVSVNINNCACPVILTTTDPADVCAPSTVDLTASSVYTSSSTGGAVTITYWTDAAATASSLASPSTVSTSGVYYIKSDDGACNVIKPVTVTINTKPNLNITNPGAVCSPSTVDITASGVTTGSTGGGNLTYWTDAACSSTLTSPAAVTTGTTYYIKATTVDGCTDSKPVLVTINATPVLTITDPSGACPPSTVDITSPAVTAGSTGGGSFTYFNDLACTSPLASPAAVAASGTYYIKSTNVTCTDTKPVVVSISAPVLTISNPLAVCAPLTVDITAPAVTAGSTGNGVLTYYTDAGCTAVLASPNAISVGTTYYIKSTSGICSDKKPVVVTINTTPALTITAPTAVCSPLTIDITAPAVTAGSTGGGVLSYWTDNLATSSLANTTAISSTATYYIKATNGSCFDIQPVTATINITPSLAITDPIGVCTPSTVNLTAAGVTSGSSAGTLTYWTDNSATTALASPAAVSLSGTYYIKSTVGTCFDIKPVIATLTTTPSLVITNPSTVCEPLTIDITDPAVTSGSTGAGTLSYWTNAGATTSLSNTTAITASAVYYIKSANGICSDIKSVTITITPTPVLTNTNPAAVCSPSTVSITNAGVSSIPAATLSYWTDNLASTPLNTPATISTSGTYYIKATNNGCFDIKPVVATINITPSLSITNPIAVCSPLTIDLTAASVTNGSTGGGILSYWIDVTATQPIATSNSVSVTGRYYIKALSGNCFDIKPVDLTVNTTPILTTNAPPAVCFPSTVNLTTASVLSGSTGVGTLTYWTDVAATIPLASSTAVATSGTYYIKSTSLAGNCTDIKPVIVTVNTSPTLVITTPNEVCEPLTIDLTNPAITAGSDLGTTITYCANALGTSILTSPTVMRYTGTYYIKSTLNGCSTIAPVNIQINPKPKANFTPTPAIVTTINPTSVMLNSTIGAIGYAWIFNDGGVSGEISPEHIFPDKEQSNQLVILIATSDKGCKDTTSKIVIVNEELVYYVPNTFTPDDDDFNQVFKPVFTTGYAPTTYHLTIFNRWGEIVFESFDPAYGWNGKLGADGNLVQVGTYNWKIEFKLKANDTHKEIVGYVNILK